ncbi:MAG: xanthine dehydrogenase family protein molybdopterin-binding subunit [Chloroflexota bacterium]
MTTERTTSGAVGASARRVDGVAKVTGAARYTADTNPAGALFAKTLRSPYPHARIVSIDTARAEALPGVKAVVTGADIFAGARHGRMVVDVPVLAQGKVCFVGEQVAGVAAVDEETALAACELIEVVYEELPAATTIDEAMAPDAPLIHPEMLEYKGLPKPLEEASNVYTRFDWMQGDAAAGFAQADVVVEHTYSTPRQHQGYMEPHTCLVEATPDGRLAVWAGNKSPYPAKRMLSVATGLEAERIVLNPVTIGGDFGGKGSAMDIPIAWLLSRKTGTPVRINFDYTEDLTAGNPRHGSRIILKTGFKRDGTITAHEALVIYDSGAYAGFKPGGHLGGAVAAGGGPYRIANCTVTELQVYTNAVPCGFMRGPGEPQAMFAMEAHLDRAAHQLGLDPVQVRLCNLVSEGDANGVGAVFTNVRARETLDAALKASGYKVGGGDVSGPVRRGFGVALGERAQAGGETHAEVQIHSDGRIEAYTTVFEQGTGSYTMMAQIVAQELGVPVERVTMKVWTTDEASFDSGIGGARVTRMASAALYEAATGARDAAVRLAAELEGWPQEQLSASGGAVRRADTGAAVDWADLARRTGAPVVGKGDVNDAGRNAHTAYTAQVAEVEVDTETGQVRLVRMTTAHDTGTVLNPMGHQGQINGGLVQGIGYGLMEDLAIEDGRVLTPSLADYKLPTAADLPELRTVLLEPGPGVGPYNVKGIGEHSNAQTAPAIVNAVADAVGVHIADLPVTAERVHRALRES